MAHPSGPSSPTKCAHSHPSPDPPNKSDKGNIPPHTDGIINWPPPSPSNTGTPMKNRYYSMRIHHWETDGKTSPNYYPVEQIMPSKIISIPLFAGL